VDSSDRIYQPFSDNSGTPIQSWSGFEQSSELPQHLGFPSPTIDYNQGVINPSKNPADWYGAEGFETYKQTMQTSNRFAATFGLNSIDGISGGERQTLADSTAGSTTRDASQSEVEKEQELLRQAYENGGALVVSLGGRDKKDTDKLRSTLESVDGNPNDRFLYGDSDNLNPDLQISRSADQLKQRGLWDGDLPITFTSKVERNADGTFSIGKPAATFQGGRTEIASILSDQMKYARGNPAQKSEAESNGTRLAPASDNAAGGENIPGRDESVEKNAQEREQAEAWEAALKEFSGKPYSADEYAENWPKFLDHAQMQDSPVKDLTAAFGKELYEGKGEFDGKKISDLMNAAGPTDQESVDATLAGVNQILADSGVTLRATINQETGKINAFEMSGIQPGGGAVRLSVDANGNVEASEGLESSRKQAGLEHVSLRLAKQVESDACP